MYEHKEVSVKRKEFVNQMHIIALKQSQGKEFVADMHILLDFH